MTPEILWSLVDAYPLFTPAVHSSGMPQSDDIGGRLLNIIPDLRQLVTYFG